MITVVSPSWCHRFLIIYLLFREPSSGILSGQVCWWQIVLSFSWPESILIYFSFLKDVFSGIGFWVNSFFVQRVKKYHFLVTFLVSGEKSTVVLIIFPLQCHFFLAAFKIFLCLYFQKFNYDVSWHGFLWVYLARNLLSFLNLKVSITSHQIWGVFSHYFFKCFFSSKRRKELLSFWASDDKNEC